VWSLIILVTLLRQRDRTSSWIDGREVLMIFFAVIISLWRDFWFVDVQLLYQTERLLAKMLSIVPQ